MSRRTTDRKRRSNLDRRTTRHAGYGISLSRRWLIEKGFGWLKQIGPIRQVKLRGLHKVDWLFVFSCAVHNLCRLPKTHRPERRVGFRETCAREQETDSRNPQTANTRCAVLAKMSYLGRR